MSGTVNIGPACLLILSSALKSRSCRRVQGAAKSLQTGCKWLQDPASWNGLDDMGLQAFGRISGARRTPFREQA